MASSSNSYSNYGYGKYQTGLRNEVQKMRRRLQEIEWRKEREQHILEEEQRKLRELEKFRMMEAERKEIERKTKRYFAFDNYDRKKLVKDRSYYFGDHELNNTAWRPDGAGQFIDQEDTILEGKFRKGDFQGGTVSFRSTDQTWKGKVKFDLIQGSGTMTTKTYREKTAKDLYFAEDDLEPGSYNVGGKKPSAGREFSLKKEKLAIKAALEEPIEDEPLDSARRRRLELEEKRKNMVEMTQTDSVLVLNGEIICTKDELVPGTRIEFFDDQYARAGITDSIQLATTNLSPPRYTRNSAVHRIEHIRSYQERMQAIDESLPNLQMYRIPGPYAQFEAKQKRQRELAEQSPSNTSSHYQPVKQTLSLVDEVYHRNAGPIPLNALDRGHFSLQATIIEHRRDWKYLVRLDDEVYPRDRILDFEHIGRFRLFREQPRIYHLHSFPAVFANDPQNNTPYHANNNKGASNKSVVSAQFFDDVSSLGGGGLGNESQHTNDHSSGYFHSEASEDHSSTFSYNFPAQRVVAHPDHPRHTMDYREHLPDHQVTTRALLPVLPTRSAHAKRENYFETAMMGFGTTQQEEELKERQRLQRIQWKKFINDKKLAFEADRQRQIEEEQAKQLQASVAKAVEEKLSRAQQDADDDEMTRRSAMTSVFSEFGDEEEDEEDVDKDVKKSNKKGKTGFANAYKQDEDDEDEIDDDARSGKSSLSSKSSLTRMSSHRTN